MSIDDRKRRLIWHGMFLLLLGLLTGLVEQKFANARMALAAHLEGVTNGTFLIALGAVWAELRQSPVIEPIAYWSALYVTYFNWVFTTFAAVTGASSLSPITGSGHMAQPWQEYVVKNGFLTVGIAIIASSVLILAALRRTNSCPPA